MEFKNKLEEIRKIEQNDLIKIPQDNIKKSEQLIELYKKEIEDEYNKGFQIIKNIRKLSEKEENHKDNLICNELKENKKKELEVLNKQLDEIIENNVKVEKEKNKMIIEEIKKIEKNKSLIRDYDISTNDKIRKEIEKTKYEALLKFGNYIYDNEQNKNLLQILNQQQ